MENEQTLFKGELMEELLRNYFLNLGYYVVRGIKLKYENNDLTDIDLYLYGRSSTLTRQRINVDIKNKKSPQAFERIVWANGLMKILNFDSCIVATTDSRPVVQSFAHAHKTTILDGDFLKKLHINSLPDRVSEEDLMTELSKHKSYKSYGNKDWKFIYETSKSKLLTEQDFSGFNSSLTDLHYFTDKAITDEQKKEAAIRLSYLVLSHMLIIIDFILKDIAFLEQQDREKRLSDGLKFGNLGKDGVDKIISMAVQIAGGKSAGGIMKSLENIPTNILRDFFSKNENAKNIFTWAKDFESLGFKKVLTYPDKIDTPLKAIISVMLDFMGVERKKYFETLQTKV